MTKTKNTAIVLLHKYPIISEQVTQASLNVILNQLESVLIKAVPGDVVELGCYIGTTTLFLRRLLLEYDNLGDRKLYAYDSFEGLPAKSIPDSSGAGEQFKGGELSVSKKQFLQEFKRASLPPPKTIKGWFADLKPAQMPDSIAFAYLDGDFYQSIYDSLTLVWPRLAPGGIITVDDYQRAALPGVERAVSDFFATKDVNIRREQSIAVITRR